MRGATSAKGVSGQLYRREFTDGYVESHSSLVGLAVYFGCFGMAKSDEDVDVRLVAETKLLFRTVLADETPPERCELEPTWRTYSIPESVAREHFGLTLELCTTAPFGESLRDILELPGDEDL